ncbi:MAG: hypothetical protein ABI183_09235 [Polyangiaceae bacterium]
MLFAIVLCGCRDHAAAISTDQAAPSSSAPGIDAAPFDLDAAVDASDANVGAPFDAGPLKAAVHVGDVEKWLTDRGVPASQLGKFSNGTGCVEIAVGTLREAALVCADVKEASRNASLPADYVYRMIDHRIVRVVRAGSVVSVLDAEITLEPLDREMGMQGNLLDLRFRLAPDGMSATLDDHGPGVSCASAQSSNAYFINKKSPEDKAGRTWALFDLELTTRMCNARGGYMWQGDHFVRDPNWKDPTPPGAHVTSAPTSTARSQWDPRSGEGSH